MKFFSHLVSQHANRVFRGAPPRRKYFLESELYRDEEEGSLSLLFVPFPRLFSSSSEKEIRAKRVAKAVADAEEQKRFEQELTQHSRSDENEAESVTEDDGEDGEGEGEEDEEESGELGEGEEDKEEEQTDDVRVASYDLADHCQVSLSLSSFLSSSFPLSSLIR